MLLAPPDRDDFARAYALLKHRLGVGHYLPGERIYIKLLADQLKVSPTPVREALSRMVGQGLITERRGSGYYVATLEAAEIAGLYRLLAIYLDDALRSGAAQNNSLPPTEILAASPSRDPSSANLAALFRNIIRSSGNVVLADVVNNVAMRLDRVRAVEAQVFPDAASEADALLDHAGEQGPQALRRAISLYFRRRVRAAALLAAATRELPASDGYNACPSNIGGI